MGQQSSPNQREKREGSASRLWREGEECRGGVDGDDGQLGQGVAVGESSDNLNSKKSKIMNRTFKGLYSNARSIIGKIEL